MDNALHFSKIEKCSATEQSGDCDGTILPLYPVQPENTLHALRKCSAPFCVHNKAGKLLSVVPTTMILSFHKNPTGMALNMLAWLVIGFNVVMANKVSYLQIHKSGIKCVAMESQRSVNLYQHTCSESGCRPCSILQKGKY